MAGHCLGEVFSECVGQVGQTPHLSTWAVSLCYKGPSSKRTPQFFPLGFLPNTAQALGLNLALECPLWVPMEC